MKIWGKTQEKKSLILTTVPSFILKVSSLSMSEVEELTDVEKALVQFIMRARSVQATVVEDIYKQLSVADRQNRKERREARESAHDTNADTERSEREGTTGEVPEDVDTLRNNRDQREQREQSVVSDESESDESESEEMEESEAFQASITSINHSLHELGFVIKKFYDSDTEELYYTFINTSHDEVSKLMTLYSPKDIQLINKVIETIYKRESKMIDETDLSNVIHRATEGSYTRIDSVKLLSSLVEDKWLNVSGGEYQLSGRLLAELGETLKSY